MKRGLSWWMRALHRHGGIAAALPFLVVLGSGLLLQWKKEAAWIQPPTRRGAGGPPSVPFAAILEAARGVSEARISGWEDVERLDVRPELGVVKVWGGSGVEVQVDTTTGGVLQVMRRRSDLIESIHDGSWFHTRAKHWVFFPAALVLVLLCLSGIYLWWLPHGARRRRGSAAARGSIPA